MITTVTMNPCIDKTVYLPSLTVGQLNLVEDSRLDVAGKGVNVAVVLQELGQEVLCAGINFDGNGHIMTDHLDKLGVPYDFVTAPGDIRTNIKVMDRQRNQMTEINSKGDVVADTVIEELLTKLEGFAARSTVMSFSGRIPNGAENDLYKRCVERVRPLGVKVVLDAERWPLREAIPAGPYVIKPNLYELETGFNIKITSHKEAVAVCREVIRQGVSVVCVSMGADGALIVDENEAWYAPALPVTPKGFPGAGDSMVAGICKAVEENRSIADMLRFGMAASHGSIIREGTLLCQRADYDNFLPQIPVFAIA